MRHDFGDEHALRGAALAVDRDAQFTKDLDLGLMPEDLGVEQEPVHIEERGAKSHSKTLTHAHYLEPMVHVRPFDDGDTEAVVARVRAQLQDARVREPFINDAFDEEEFATALRAQRAQLWVALREGDVVGHLYGALLNDERGTSAWVGPDGVSFDDLEVLAALYARAGAAWFERGAHEHWVWIANRDDAFLPWSELGFAKEHRRGVARLSEDDVAALPEGYLVREGGVGDYDVARELDALLDEAQRDGPNFFFSEAAPGEGITDTLDDPDVRLHLLDYRGEVVAQCLTYPLDVRRGSFEDVVHVSGVVVRDEWRRQGLGTAFVTHVLSTLAHEGTRYVEVHWRVANYEAQRFWQRRGFHPTFTRLRRVLDV